MKANRIIMLRVLGSTFNHNNSIIESFEYLYRFKLINQKEFKDLNNIFKESASLFKILNYLKINRNIIEFIIFFNNYYSLDESINISLLICEERKNLKKDLISSLIYPVILILLSTLAIYFISNSIVPQLFVLSSEQNISYIIIVNLLKFIPLLFFVVTLLLIIFLITMLILLKKDFNKYIKVLIRIKIIKSVIKFITSITFALYFKEVLNNIHLSKKSIEIIKSQTSNLLIQYITSEFIAELDSGVHIFDLISKSLYLSDDLKQTLLIAKDSLSMSHLLNNYYDLKMSILKRKLKLFVSIFVPVVISIVGVILVLMYLLIMLPIINMSTSL